MKPRWTKALLCLIAIIQIVLGVWFYRGRRVEQWSAEDGIVFGIPPMIAAAMNYSLLRVASRWDAGYAGLRRWELVAISIGVAFLSFFATMLVNLNVYGS